MRIERINNGFIQFYDNKVVEKTICNYNGICMVFFHDKPPRELCIGSSSYNAQYGMPVSEDGSKIFIGFWDKEYGDYKKGLLAYDIKSGSMLWGLAEGKIRNIFVYPNYLIIVKASASILKVDIVDGIILEEIKSGTIEHIYDLGFPFVLADTITGSLRVVNVESMTLLKSYGSKYKSKIINPLNCLGFTITKAILYDNILTISGFEEYPDKNYNIVGSNAFDRVIDSDFSSRSVN